MNSSCYSPMDAVERYDDRLAVDARSDIEIPYHKTAFQPMSALEGLLKPSTQKFALS
jgi:hypothetical protein